MIMRLLVMFDLPTETAEDLKHYRKLIKILEQEAFYRFQYSVFVRICINPADVDAVKVRLKSALANYPGDIMAMSMTDKQFVLMEPINWKTDNGINQSIAASSKRMIVI